MKREQGSEGETEVRGPSRFVPPEAWIAAFQRQYSGVMIQLVAGYAIERMAGVGAAPNVDDAHDQDDQDDAAERVAGVGAALNADDPPETFPRVLVFKALTDTLVGVVRWNPNTKTLEKHIRDVIKGRAKIDWKHAKKRAETKYPHPSIDTTNANGRSPTLEEVDRVLSDRQSDPRATAYAREALDELRQRAHEDPELLAYIAARANGVPRAELMRVTGLSIASYRKVRRRLIQLNKQLSIHATPHQGE